MDVRKATLDDSDDLLAWRNDPIARTMFKSRDIVDCTTHSAWLTHALGDPGTLILIGENAGNKVGIVRFELLEKSLERQHKYRSRPSWIWPRVRASSESIEYSRRYT